MSTDMSPCPMCGNPLSHSRQITLCGACYGSVTSANPAQVSSTGEFAALPSHLADAVLREPPPSSPAPDPVLACTWCGKPRQQVKKLLQGNKVSICNECVALCSDIMAAELGDNWR